jgi:hypothetical protein
VTNAATKDAAISSHIVQKSISKVAALSGSPTIANATEISDIFSVLLNIG